MDYSIFLYLACWYGIGLVCTSLCNIFDVIYKKMRFDKTDIFPIVLFAFGGLFILIFTVYYYFSCRKYKRINQRNDD